MVAGIIIISYHDLFTSLKSHSFSIPIRIAFIMFTGTKKQKVVQRLFLFFSLYLVISSRLYSPEKQK